MKHRLLLSALILSFSISGFAKPLAKKKKLPPAPPPAPVDFPGLVRAELAVHKKINPQVRDWFLRITQGSYESAFSLWPAVRRHVPAGLNATAEAGELYLLYKLDLAQTFLDRWLEELPGYQNSKAFAMLETEVAPGFESWLSTHPVVLTAKAKRSLAQLSEKKRYVLVLKAWDARRDPAKAAVLLPKLGPTAWLSRNLVNTLIYQYARKGEIKPVAGLLKRYIEPSILITKNYEELAEKDLTLARLLFQAGNLEAARDFYSKVPNTSKYFLSAREELAWVYLRMGDTQRVRGEVVALTESGYETRFAPENLVVRGISDIKMCFYDKVENDIREFQRVNGVWAKRIAQGISDPAKHIPTGADEYMDTAVRTVKRLESEQAKLSGFKTKGFEKVLVADLAEAKHREIAESSRVWKSRRKEMIEAIRKMRFVKTEYLSEMLELTRRSTQSGTMVAANDGAAALKGVGRGQIVFPVDREVWPDELFHMRSSAKKDCFNYGGAK